MHGVGQVGVVRLDACVARRVAAPQDRGGDDVRGGLQGEEAVEERRGTRHVVQRVGAGVVRAEVEEDDVRRLDGAEPGGQLLEDSVAAVGAVEAPAAVALVVGVHAVRLVLVGGVGAHVVHVVPGVREQGPERPAVAAGAGGAGALGDRVAERHDAEHGVCKRERGGQAGAQENCQWLIHVKPPSRQHYYSIILPVSSNRLRQLRELRAHLHNSPSNVMSANGNTELTEISQRQGDCYGDVLRAKQQHLADREV